MFDTNLCTQQADPVFAYVHSSASTAWKIVVAPISKLPMFVQHVPDLSIKLFLLSEMQHERGLVGKYEHADQLWIQLIPQLFVYFNSGFM